MRFHGVVVAGGLVVLQANLFCPICFAKASFSFLHQVQTNSMSRFFHTVLNWSEVWAVLIPLLVFLRYRRQPLALGPVVIYLCLALLLNLFGDIIIVYKKHFPEWLQSNNPLYNFHSLVRFACFSYFFILLKQPSFTGIKKLLPLLSLVFILVNFTLFEDFFYPQHLSGNLLSVEAYLLLVYCMLYYLSQLKAEVEEITKPFDFWIATGLSIYVVVNFFVFLFYVPMIDEDIDLAIQIWDVHNVAYIILCLFIAKAFYVSPAN